MSKLGELEEVLNNGEKELWGHLRTLELDLILRLTKNPDQRSPNSPDWIIWTHGKHGRDVQIGSAWRKLPKALGLSGEEFLSITLDDPSFGQSMNVAAFTEDNGKTWRISWRRRQDRQDSEAA
jgi:uncharacterized protein (DUF736 family)